MSAFPIGSRRSRWAQQTIAAARSDTTGFWHRYSSYSTSAFKNEVVSPRRLPVSVWMTTDVRTGRGATGITFGQLSHPVTKDWRT